MISFAYKVMTSAKMILLRNCEKGIYWITCMVFVYCINHSFITFKRTIEQVPRRIQGESRVKVYEVLYIIRAASLFVQNSKLNSERKIRDRQQQALTSSTAYTRYFECALQV